MRIVLCIAPMVLEHAVSSSSRVAVGLWGPSADGPQEKAKRVEWRCGVNRSARALYQPVKKTACGGLGSGGRDTSTKENLGWVEGAKQEVKARLPSQISKDCDGLGAKEIFGRSKPATGVCSTDAVTVVPPKQKFGSCCAVGLSRPFSGKTKTRWEHRPARARAKRAWEILALGRADANPSRL